MWDVKTEHIGTEPVDQALPNGDMTELKKITATHVETGNTYKLKARTGTAAYRKAVWDNIWNQHKERMKTVSDPLADEGKADLEGRVP